MNGIQVNKLLIVSLLWSMAPALASALPLPFSERATLGRPGRAVLVTAQATDEGVEIVATLGGRRSRVVVRASGVEDVSLERVEVGAGHHVGILRGSGASHTFAALIVIRRGTPEIPWSARTDLHGDPGERTAGMIATDDRTGDGLPDVVIGTRREGATLCGQERTLLLARAFDPSQSLLRPVVLRRLGEGEEIPVTATRETPGPQGPPLLRALDPRGASSRSGHAEDDPGALAPPRALTDGRTDTFWAEGRGGPGAQEFAVVRWNTRYRIRAFALVLSPSAEAATRLGRPRSFWLVGDTGPRLRVTVADDPLDHPGERYWVVPPEPLPWRCVGIVLDEAHAPPDTTAAAVHTGIAEIEAYTELDWGAGVDALVQVLVEGGSPGDEAARLLESLGPSGVVALSTAWDRLDARGRRRAVRVFASAGRRGAEQSIPALERAATDDAEEVRASALQALGALGPSSAEALGRLVQRPAPVGDEAIRSLLRHAPETTVPALLAATTSEAGSERPALREGLAIAIARGGEGARGAWRAWSNATGADRPSEAALASATLGLASLSATHDLAAALLPRLAPRTVRFEDRWRVVQAAAELPSEPSIDGWLATVARDAEEWMLRAAALEALGQREATGRAQVATAALADDYPRVRVAAIGVLGDQDNGDATLARLAARDSWPMVRAAAVNALFDRTAGRDAIRRATRDRSPRVRRAALSASTRAGDRGATPLVVQRLEDEDEWPTVIAQGLRYVGELCVTEAGEAVLAVLRRGIRPGAWAPDVDVAEVAADLAIRLGGETAEDAMAIANRSGTPESIRAVVERRRANPAPCVAASAADASSL